MTVGVQKVSHPLPNCGLSVNGKYCAVRKTVFLRHTHGRGILAIVDECPARAMSSGVRYRR